MKERKDERIRGTTHIVGIGQVLVLERASREYLDWDAQRVEVCD